MLDKVRSYIDKWQMLQKEDCVIVGVSGGADSVCLLFVLLELQKEIGFDMVAVHVNHGLRGEEADADQRYVEQICKENGVKFVSYFENVEFFQGISTNLKIIHRFETHNTPISKLFNNWLNVIIYYIIKDVHIRRRIYYEKNLSTKQKKTHKR